MRIIHCADIHLDSKLSANLEGEKRKKRRGEILDSFVYMVEYAAQNGVEAILIAGDLFDTGSITKTTAGVVRKLIGDNPDIAFYYLKGNHDVYSFLHGMEGEYPNLYLFEDKWTYYNLSEGIVLSGVELNADNSRDVYDSLVIDPGRFNIVMLHGQANAYSAGDKTEIINFSVLKNRAIDYLALGHVHSFQQGMLDKRGSYCYPGCLEGRGFDECGVHGFVVADIDEDAHCMQTEFIPWGQRRIYEITADVTDCKTASDCLHRIRQSLAENEVTEKDMVRVIMRGEVEEDADTNEEYICSRMTDEYFFVKVINKTTLKIDINKYANDISLKGEFIRLVTQDGSLGEEEKAEIIRTGLMALAGEEV